MKKLKRYILKLAVRNLLNAVTIDDLLRIEQSKLFIGDRQLTDPEVAALQNEARVFKRSLLWKLMNYNLYWIANFKMIRGADSEIDMQFGRAMTHTIGTLEAFIDKLSKK